MRCILKTVFWWRILLLVAAFTITSFIGFVFPYPNFPYLIQEGHETPWLWSWGGFDGVHYITIAESGYVSDFTQAFFPVYPAIMGFFHTLLRVNGLISGLFVTHISLFVAMALFWKLLLIDLPISKAKAVILSFLLFPTAFYLGAVYSESTFLVFLFGSFLVARKGRWGIASIAGCIASATRPVGILLFPALLVERWLQRRKDESLINFIRKPATLSLLLIPIGLFLYMNYLSVHFDDPLKFLHAQPIFGAGRTDRIVLLYQVLWRYAKMLVTVQPLSLLYFRITQELGSSILFLILGILSFKLTRASYAVFALFAYLMPTLTGTFSSMPRYVLVMFPVFMMVGSWLSEHRRTTYCWYIASGILLLINMTLFLTGRWVA